MGHIGIRSGAAFKRKKENPLKLPLGIESRIYLIYPMSTLQLRPRFQHYSELNKEQILEKFKKHQDNKDLLCQVAVVTHHVIMKILPKERHYWSPNLNLEVIDKDQGSIIYGLIGPAPAVWTMFMFIYTGIGFLGVFGLFYGLSQWTLDMTPTALWAVPAAILLEVIFYFIARTGKNLAREQTNHLYSIYKNILKIEE